MIVQIKFVKPFKVFTGIACHIYMIKRSYKVLFFGSDDFSLYSLRELHSSKENNESISTLDVVTSSQKNVVSKYAQAQKLNLYPWPPDISSHSFDLGVVVSFGHLIPKKHIDCFPQGMINVHASLLPQWRGASPIIHSILNGDLTTGVTIMKINPHHFDTGNILLQKPCSIDPNELMPSLHQRLGLLGASCLKETLKNLPEYISRSKQQTDENATFAPRIKPSIAVIIWKEQSSTHIYNLYRALYSVYELRTFWHSASVKLKSIKMVSKEEHCKLPGTIEWNRLTKQLIVWCRVGSISVDALSFGGKLLKPVDFYNGYLSKRKKIEWYFE